MVIINKDDYLAHYGILRRSGRYPWGSSNNVNTRNKSFLDFIDDMKRQGLSEAEIAQGQGITIAQMRAAKTYARNEIKRDQIATAEKLKAKGMSNPAIARQMNLPGESSVRALLAPGEKDKTNILINISNELKSHVDKKGIIDIGSGVETHMNISEQRLAAAVFVLKEQGYEVHTVPIPQIGTDYNTRTKVLMPPGSTQKNAWEKRFQIQQISTQTDDGGRHFAKEHPIVAISPRRVSIRYSEDGGANADGVIYVRPGKKDLSMGKSNYAQVRIQVGENHFLKGMAMYKDDLPDGVDLVFNTNKKKAEYPNKLDTMKKISSDPDLPFESVVRPIILDLGHPVKERVKSAMNIVNEEGDWDRWSDTLSSQVLSKQRPIFVKQQLDLTYNRHEREFNEILKLTNPAVKRKLLEDFADASDSAAGHLRSAALPRQSWKAILPIESLKPTEIYAPSYENGEQVVLIRFPHGGRFEIPEVTVNNRHRESRRMLKDAVDAIGIHPSIAARMSGADFDGDTVLVIPNKARKIQTDLPLEKLKNFDPMMYKLSDDAPRMKSSTKQTQMGVVSNLITDMTIRGASNDELARAIKHSMVVIDAEKHHLDYRRSERDNNIRALQAEYQSEHRDTNRAGASTLISKKKGTIRRPELKGLPDFPQGAPFDKTTGEKLQIETGRTRRNRDGSISLVEKEYRKLDLTNDAHTLSSGTTVEKHFANYSNKQKALANNARVKAFNTPPIEWSSSAKRVYNKEVAALTAKLNLAKKNRTLERHARVIANAAIKAKRDANPHLDGDSLKKIKYQELARARTRTKADQRKIIIESNEWKAIQAGAISNSMLKQILAKADMGIVREFATPRPKLLMTSAKTAQAKTLLESGYTRAEVARRLGVSLTTLDTGLS